jgi:hypothetical protein
MNDEQNEEKTVFPLSLNGFKHFFAFICFFKRLVGELLLLLQA